MKYEIELEEKDLDLILQWFGCQDETDTWNIIIDHDLKMNVGKTESALRQLFLELRDKCPIEYKISRLQGYDEHDSEASILRGEIAELYTTYCKIKSNPTENSNDILEQISAILHIKINDYNFYTMEEE